MWIWGSYPHAYTLSTLPLSLLPSPQLFFLQYNPVIHKLKIWTFTNWFNWKQSVNMMPYLEILFYAQNDYEYDIHLCCVIKSMIHLHAVCAVGMKLEWASCLDLVPRFQNLKKAWNSWSSHFRERCPTCMSRGHRDSCQGLGVPGWLKVAWLLLFISSVSSFFLPSLLSSPPFLGCFKQRPFGIRTFPFKPSFPFPGPVLSL